MKCFVHFDQEAIAACRTCGKGMCARCSAYSQHSGVCPDCRKEEFKKEVVTLTNSRSEIKWDIFKSAALTILLCWTVVFGIWFGYKWYKNVAELRQTDEKIEALHKEIRKLENVRASRSTNASI